MMSLPSSMMMLPWIEAPSEPVIRSSSGAQGRTRPGQAFDSPHQPAQIVERGLSHLRAAGMNPTTVDIRCLISRDPTRSAIG